MFVKKRESLFVVALVVWAIMVYPSLAFPYATASHKDINQAAVQGSPTLDKFFTDVLGFMSGLNTKIKNTRGVNNEIIEWIKKGGEAEDQLYDGWGGEFFGTLRSLNHFHQPRRSESQAGYKSVWPSSRRWAQKTSQTQSPGRKASWFDGRDYYLNALLARTQRDRYASFAEAFQSVGQVMHLVEDSGSVPHVRDDTHIAYS